MGNHIPEVPVGFEKKLISLIGKLGVFIALLLLPPIFTSLFSVSELVFNEKEILWFFSVFLLIISFLQILFSSKIKTSISLLFFILLFFISIELLTRSYVALIYNDTEKQGLADFANKTYEKFAKYKGHPFLVYTGNPSTKYMDGNEEKESTAFNNMGFVGNDFSLEKQKNTIRIACVGGSTTERGYPKITEYQLNKFFNNTRSFEVMNFGVSGWTSANSLINYMFNVRDFNPDYVLIHHGWNEDRIRNTPDSLFRRDYSHALTYFHEPEIIDKLPIRTSVLYRILKNTFSYTPDWVFLGDATTIKNRPKTTLRYQNINELAPFERNIKTIIDLCIQNNTKVILCTQPFSLTKEDNTSETIEQANKIVRKINKSYLNKIDFIDLDKTVTGNMNDVFIDIAHMNEVGAFFKGSEFARVIINDLLKKDTVQPFPPYFVKPICYHKSVDDIILNPTNKSLIIKKAKERNLTLHEMLKKDIMYIFNQKNETIVFNKEFEYNLQEYVIRRNPEWMENIKKKALEDKITLEESLQLSIEASLIK